jgi:hypothetical protein
MGRPLPDRGRLFPDRTLTPTGNHKILCSFCPQCIRKQSGAERASSTVVNVAGRYCAESAANLEKEQTLIEEALTDFNRRLHKGEMPELVFSISTAPVVDPLLLHEAARELEVRFAVLNAIVALIVGSRYFIGSHSVLRSFRCEALWSSAVVRY